MAGNLHRAHLVIRGPKANAARLPRRTRPLIRPANLKRRSAPMPLLVLIRHGQRAWNLDNRFTGWWDVDVTELGAAEAKAAGALIDRTSTRLKSSHSYAACMP